MSEPIKDEWLVSEWLDIREDGERISDPGGRPYPAEVQRFVDAVAIMLAEAERERDQARAKIGEATQLLRRWIWDRRVNSATEHARDLAAVLGTTITGEALAELASADDQGGQHD